MKIETNPMPALRQQAAEKVDAHFAARANVNVHRDQIHSRKLQAARAVLDGGEPPSWFAHEAELRGLPADELARTILNKSAQSNDTIEHREARRQTAMIAIEKARTPQEIEQIVSGLR
jgi:hypothetical protein